MEHLGDITKIDGAAVESIEVIVGGSPCQDLSVAGRREGLKGERSGLFMEQIRIIKEMRRKDIESGAINPRPRYMVWENVPGAFSSNKGEDFRIVLEETARVCDPTAVIPRPEGGRWTYSGAILGDGWSIAWRVHDAQFWGVPQRRLRIALVADFGGYAAPEILFERNGLSRNTPPSSTPWKDFAAAIAERFGGTDHPKRTIDGPGPSHSTYCSTLTARGPSAVCMATQQGGAEIRTDDKAPTLTAAAGMSGNNQPVYANAEHTVRRLTPLECERLQGYPDGWMNIGTYIDSRGKERKASDSARYKALGNSIALPPWAWILERLNGYCTVHTMASLFDGIGGFPLIWETLNGKGSCLWASEIEEFPIAVTKYHFGG